MKNFLFVLTLLSLTSPCFATGETITIAPVKKAPKHQGKIYATEKISVSGQLQTVPMGGAMLTLQSTNFGQILLFSPFAPSKDIQSRLEKIEGRHVTVTISGALLTTCSASELRQANRVGCREFDNTKEIEIKPW
jgi:hypothetical protein